ncbi:MAG: M28 family metallopeptidase [Steroidobacteraceae bacterium]
MRKIVTARSLAVMMAFLCAPLGAQELSAADQAVANAAIKAIRPEAIAAHMRFLSDDLLEGRQTGSRGHELAVQYVATELEAMGLAPGGVNGTWFQNVPIRKVELVPEQSSLELVRDGKAQTLVFGQDYIMDGNPLAPDSGVEAGAAFVGFGVSAPEFQYDDYAGVDVLGKVVVMVRGAPPRFPSTERAYFSDAVVKARNAAAHGAVGIITVMPPEFFERYKWDWIVPQIRAGGMWWLDPQGVPADTYPEIRASALMNESGARELFAGAPKTSAEIFAASRDSKSESFELPLKLKIHRATRYTALESRNVIAKLAGSDPTLAKEYVVFSAHMDHLGICRPAEPDSVCHGAWDNASGTSAVLEVARAFSTLHRAPRRSILFVFVTGEEKGLRGSDYFARYPTVPIEKIVADVNIDGAPGMIYPNKDIVPLGVEHSSLSKNVQAAARRMGYTISPDPLPEEVIFIRSDQYSFVKQGVPAVFINAGMQSVDPTLDGGAIFKKWISGIYHTPKDNMSQTFYFDSAARSTALSFLVGYEVAQQAERPMWNAGDFFGTKFSKQQH